MGNKPNLTAWVIANLPSRVFVYYCEIKIIMMTLIVFLVLSCVHLHFIYSCNNILLEIGLGTFYVIYQQYLLKSQSKMFELIKYYFKQFEEDANQVDV